MSLNNYPFKIKELPQTGRFLLSFLCDDEVMEIVITRGYFIKWDRWIFHDYYDLMAYYGEINIAYE